MAEAAIASGRGLARESAIAEALALGSRVEGQHPLRARETDVAEGIARGLTNRQIAAELVITEGTVANHVAHVLAKLNLRSRAQIAVWASAQLVPSAIAE
jgi:DNA-binding NarL/FixJ family response regulator